MEAKSMKEFIGKHKDGEAKRILSEHGSAADGLICVFTAYASTDTSGSPGGWTPRDWNTKRTTIISSA